MPASSARIRNSPRRRCQSPSRAKVIRNCKRDSKTTAAIVATAVSIDRFETAGKLIGYYGIFPEEWQSGVDKFGNPVPTGKKIMCRKGNDLVHGLLWQCAKCASAENGGNPAVRALYVRRLAAGDTPQIAWGYCMTKLLRQVFGVWTTGTPFDPQHEAKRQQKTEASGHNDESYGPVPVRCTNSLHTSNLAAYLKLVGVERFSQFQNPEVGWCFELKIEIERRRLCGAQLKESSPDLRGPSEMTHPVGFEIIGHWNKRLTMSVSWQDFNSRPTHHPIAVPRKLRCLRQFGTARQTPPVRRAL